MRLDVAALAWIAFCGAASAEDQDQPSPEQAAQYHRCDAAASKATAVLPLTFDRVTPMAHNIFFTAPGVSDVAVMCGFDSIGFSVSLNTNPFPPASFFLFAAKGGSAVTGEPVSKLLPVLHRCHRMAMRDKDEAPDDIAVGQAKVSCHAFTRDGGATSLDIWTKQ